MFGLRNKSAEQEQDAASGALGRIGRRTTIESRTEGQAPTPPADRQTRVVSAAASLADSVVPRLRELVNSDVPPGEITRQAGQLIQIHFRGQGVMLAPLELRSYVAEVLRPILPATSFAAVPAPVGVPAEPSPETQNADVLAAQEALILGVQAAP